MRDSFLPRILVRSGFGPLVFVPALDLDVLLVELAERRDKGARQSSVRDERNVEVDRKTITVLVVGLVILVFSVFAPSLMNMAFGY